MPCVLEIFSSWEPTPSSAMCVSYPVTLRSSESLGTWSDELVAVSSQRSAWSTFEECRPSRHSTTLPLGHKSICALYRSALQGDILTSWVIPRGRSRPYPFGALWLPRGHLAGPERLPRGALESGHMVRRSCCRLILSSQRSAWSPFE